ncbi:MAG: acyl-CoA dehydrogenase family protein [Candidatus Binatia bacterium]
MRSLVCSGVTRSPGVSRGTGSFQAIKHIAAEMASAIEPARAPVWYAPYAFDAVPRDAPRAAAMAKTCLSEVYSRTANRAVQIRGGIGFTWEHDIQLWLKRAPSGTRPPAAIPSTTASGSRAYRDSDRAHLRSRGRARYAGTASRAVTRVVRLRRGRTRERRRSIGP